MLKASLPKCRKEAFLAGKGSKMHEISRRIQQGRGTIDADLVLRGGRVLDLVTGALLEGDVAICGSHIVGTAAEYAANTIIDVSDLILVPGFIDTHLHVESSMMTPQEFDRCVAPRGVTTAICDPHEIANVLGVEGIKYFQRASERTLMDLRVQLSSCVPSCEMETAGAEILASDLATLRDHSSGIGLAELMNFPGVLDTEPRVMAKLELFYHQHIDGHAPLLGGKDLNGYIAAGVRTEHEATSAEEAREKLQKGLRVLIREGSVCHDLDRLQPVLNETTSAYMCLCTDDRNPLDIAEHGHLDYMIRRLISLGTQPLAAYRAASLSAAEAFGLKDRGLIAPGKRADIVALKSLEDCNVERVFCAGVELTEEAFEARKSCAAIGRYSVKLPKLSEQHFCLVRESNPEPVIGIIDGKVLTEYRRIEVPAQDGDKKPDPSQDLARISVIERHGKNGRIANGFVQGFGIRRGAIASTVAHDHHNVVCLGVDYADMLCAVQRLAEIEGGYVIAEGAEVKAELALPIAGLMSMQPFERVREGLMALRVQAKRLGVTLNEPFVHLSFVALPVIPHLKITDHGMIDVDAFRVISP